MNDKRETKKTTEKENNMSISDEIIGIIEEAEKIIENHYNEVK